MSDDSPFDRYDEEVRQRLEWLEILRKGADVWNIWRKENPNILPDLSQANLRGANLKAANFSEINLGGANLEEANLDRAIFRGANLNRANLRRSYLQEADFMLADMKDADLTGANLRWAFFINHVNGARLDEALYLTQGQIETAKGDWRTLLPPGLIHPDHWEKEPEPLFDFAPNTPEDGPNPEHLAMLRRGVGAWNKWRAQYANMRPFLNGAHLQEADLKGFNLEGADLQRADIGNADLGDANLEGANLSGTTLTGANLENAYLGLANLEGADLSYANLNNVDGLTQKQIETASGDWSTILPNSLEFPNHWNMLPDEPDEPDDTATREAVSDLSTKLSLSSILSPIPMAWNAEGKIAVVAPKERPPAHGLSPNTRDLLAQALTAMAADLANHIRNGNSDQNIAKRLDAYARECAKGGAELNILRLDAIVRTLSGLVRKEKDALSAIDLEEYSVFAGDHDRLTGFYPDFEDYQQALARAPNIPDPPNIDLAKLLREPPGPDMIDASVPDAIDNILPGGGGLPASRGTDSKEVKERKFTLMKIVEGLKLALEMPGVAVNALAAIPKLYAYLKPFFDWLK